MENASPEHSPPTPNPSVRYLYANFTDSSCNFGNSVIDYATRRLFQQFFPLPTAEFDWFDGEFEDRGYDFILIPGCTMLSAGENPRFELLERATCPVYCPAGALWSELPKPGFLVRNRILFAQKQQSLDLRVVKRLSSPIGVRDSFTYRVLEKAGIPCLYAGCPTLFIPPEGIGDDGYVLLSMGRRHVRQQTAIAHALGKRHQVIGICHEKKDYARYLAAGWKLPLVAFNGDLDLYLSYFKRARVVITGRLHGALPSLAYGKPVFYYGTRDSRTTLLDDLGVPIHDFDDMDHAVERASNGFNRSLVERFRQNWQSILQTMSGHFARQGSSPPTLHRPRPEVAPKPVSS